MADGGERAMGAFAALPEPLALAVLALLPVDTRLRCREVCRGWRDALSDVSLWTRLDLSAGSGVAAARLDNAAGLLAAAALRAGGQLQCLDVTGCAALGFDALRGVVGSSAATLLEMHVAGSKCTGFEAEQLADLLRAAPHLQLLHAAELHCDTVGSFEAVRDEQLFQVVRAPVLRFHDRGDDALPLALRLIATLGPTELDLWWLELSSAAAIGAVVDAALAHQMPVVKLQGCWLSAAAAPALVRLLAGGTVTSLLLSGGTGAEEVLWDDEAGAALLSDALRASTSLRELALHEFELWRIPAAGTAVLAALTGHPSLRELDIGGNRPYNEEQTAAAAAALGALVAADTLVFLDLTFSSLGDAALGPLFDALPAVTRLHRLECYDGASEPDLVSDAFMRHRALPALRANASLRELMLGDSKRASMREAEELVTFRDYE